MTPREKAAQLVVDNQLKVRSLDYKEAVACAIITVDEILDMVKHTPIEDIENEYWQEVKQEIEKL